MEYVLDLLLTPGRPVRVVVTDGNEWRLPEEPDLPAFRRRRREAALADLAAAWADRPDAGYLPAPPGARYALAAVELWPGSRLLTPLPEVEEAVVY